VHSTLLAGAGIHSLSGPRVQGTRERRAVARVEVAGVAQRAAVGVRVLEPARRKRVVGEPEARDAHARRHVEAARHHAARVAGAAFTGLACGVGGA